MKRKLCIKIQYVSLREHRYRLKYKLNMSMERSHGSGKTKFQYPAPNKRYGFESVTNLQRPTKWTMQPASTCIGGVTVLTDTAIKICSHYDTHKANQNIYIGWDMFYFTFNFYFEHNWHGEREGKWSSK